MVMRCPVCGTKLDLVELSLTARQRQIRDVVEHLGHTQGGPVPTKAIAVQVGYAPTTIRPELSTLEKMGILCRPNGPKSGWALRKEQIALARAG